MENNYENDLNDNSNDKNKNGNGNENYICYVKLIKYWVNLCFCSIN